VPRRGEHSAELARELGMTEGEIAALAAAGVLGVEPDA
jgi:crotonobetainyl-CoA:carnitine CoA-transferase CaiB-like acyl-CoA transferase